MNSDREPTLQELMREQSRMAREQKDQWKVMHETRERVAATESGMQGLQRELHAFRTESREDSRELSGAIRELSSKFGVSAANGNGNGNGSNASARALTEVQKTLAHYQGGVKIAGWAIAVLIPTIVVVLYYFGILPP